MSNKSTATRGERSMRVDPTRTAQAKAATIARKQQRTAAHPVVAQIDVTALMAQVSA